MVGSNKQVLMVEDVGPGCLCLAEYLTSNQLTVVSVSDGLQALKELHRHQFNAVITDIHVPYLDGLDLLCQCHLVWPKLPVILLSENLFNIVRPLMAHGAYACLPKPVEPKRLLQVLSEALSDTVGMSVSRADTDLG